MRKNKGFTLIELLAVIIILAVIALISTPIVLNVIENAKEKANMNSAYGLLDAGRLYYSESLLNEEKAENIKKLKNIWEFVSVSGNKPQVGELYVNQNGEIALSVIFEKKCYLKTFYGGLEQKNKNECDLGYIGNDITPPIMTIDPLEITIIEGDNYDLMSGVTIYDAESGFAFATIKIGENVIENVHDLKPGSYVITYLASDYAGNTTSMNRTLIINDRTAMKYILRHESIVSGDTTGLHQEIDYFKEPIYRYKSNSKTSIPNNYIEIDGILYQIISISKDGNLKLITSTFTKSSIFESKNVRNNANNTYCQKGTNPLACHVWGRVDGNYTATAGGSVTGTGTVTTDSELKSYLNGDYYNSLSSNLKNIITSSSWYFGAYDITQPLSFDQIYQYKSNSLIGLINAEEFYRASSVQNCNPGPLPSGGKPVCSSWIYSSEGWFWTLTSQAADSPLNGLAAGSNLGAYNVYVSAGVRPVFTTKAEIQIVKGTGNLSDPYIIS